MHFETQTQSQNQNIASHSGMMVAKPSQKTSSTTDSTLWPMVQFGVETIRSLEEQVQYLKKELKHRNERIKTLENISNTDEMTQILNRRGFYNAMDKEMDRLDRNPSETSLLLMIDLDNFKTINDTYGHDCGDMALKLVADTLQNTIRRMDITARLGGDEFVVLLSQAKTEKTLDRVQDLARKLNSLILKYDGHTIQISASVGIQPLRKGDSFEMAMAQADKEMYKKKRKKA